MRSPFLFFLLYICIIIGAAVAVSGGGVPVNEETLSHMHLHQNNERRRTNIRNIACKYVICRCLIGRCCILPSYYNYLRTFPEQSLTHHKWYFRIWYWFFLLRRGNVSCVCKFAGDNDQECKSFQPYFNDELRHVPIGLDIFFMRGF